MIEGIKDFVKEANEIKFDDNIVTRIKLLVKVED